MTAKQFFKSTAFKCIAVLLSIILVCGIILTICNSLFYVSDEERLERAINKIYGRPVTTVSVMTDTHVKDFDASEVLEAYKVEDDGNYLVKVKGKQGFDNGTVTCWVVVKMTENKVAGVDTVKIDSNTAQSYIGNIDSKELAQFSKLEYTDGFVYELGVDGKDYIPTGASVSMVAISNAVNGAIAYVNQNILGQAAKDPFAEFKHKDLINTTSETLKPKWTVSGGEVNYVINTKSNNGPGRFTFEISVDATKKITKYTITKDGCEASESHSVEYFQSHMHELTKNLIGKSLEDIESYLADENDGGYLHTGATRSNESCYEAAAFALANYDLVIQSEQGGNE